ncbi:2-oxoacid:ferredoxin oxidoreductase subunit beta [candidate division WOR-3 bacterium JGI_Cruoil_03_51_56]|uniref:2-oxoacid:ferredoxin oxidoreductase subunit beta n=1 Tax=candidate division WOR-3 bacterium JGI_Cruoil_03_51_56 TaxID=1973747 RepID=A0A235BN92_UNCW3|nr:MAG: 2-oxoacid:ferredoxin oxidoreductase subunit beta [candidate division WOR-3 bacterium JGI_Cruoil_03_51_56]
MSRLGTPFLDRNEHHPLEDYLRMDRIPHIWCPTCGLGTALNCMLHAIKKSGIPRQNIAVVSGIGCSGRAAGYVNLDSFHTTHGRAIPFATGLKLANPKLKVVLFSGDGDLIAIGGNHLIHAARRNIDLTVIGINNFNYAMTGGQFGPTTPEKARMTTAPYGSFEHPFNVPFLVDSCGATYVARWTALHVRHLTNSILEALHHKGFSFIEVISPCSTVYARRNRLGDGLDLLKYYHENSEIRNGINTRKCDITFQGRLIVGKFVDKEKPTYSDTMTKSLSEALGDRYVPYQGPMQGKNGD